MDIDKLEYFYKRYVEIHKKFLDDCHEINEEYLDGMRKSLDKLKKDLGVK